MLNRSTAEVGGVRARSEDDHGNRLGGYEPSSAVRQGVGLVGGLLRCHRCARMLRVVYKGPDNDVVRYVCTRASLDNEEACCVAFSGAAVDQAVAAEILRVVQPAAIEAAVLASQQQTQARVEVVEALRRDLQAARYRVERAEQQYDDADPRNRLVAEELERRWNLALKEMREFELRIAEEDQQEEPGNTNSLEEFAALAADLESMTERHLVS
jgi:hypothetical protein